MEQDDVLIIAQIDDDTDEKEVFREVVTKLDIKCELVQFNTCQELLDSLNHGNCFDIIIMDVRMLKINGVDCLEIIKSNDCYKDVPVIFFAGSTSEKDIDMAYKLGAHYFLNKPSNFSDYEKIFKLILKDRNWKELQNRPVREKFFIDISRVNLN